MNIKMKTMKTMILSFIVVVIIIFPVAFIISEIASSEKAEAQAQAQEINKYKIELLGAIPRVGRPLLFTIEAVRFSYYINGTYYKFIKADGEMVFYPVARTIVTVIK